MSGQLMMETVDLTMVRSQETKGRNLSVPAQSTVVLTPTRVILRSGATKNPSSFHCQREILRFAQNDSVLDLGRVLNRYRIAPNAASDRTG
jgi:hypothetical protein